MPAKKNTTRKEGTLETLVEATRGENGNVVSERIVEQVFKEGSVGGESLTQPAPPEVDHAPNLRLRKTPEGTELRALHEANGYGEYYPPLAFFRSRGVRYELPVLGDGTPDEETQKAGFYSEYAHRIGRACPHYEYIRAEASR